MYAPAERDVVVLVDAVQHAYRASSLEEYPATAMAAAAMLVRCDVASFNDVDPSRNYAVSVLDPPDYEFFPGAFELFAELQAENPLIRYVSDTGDGSAHKFTDFVTTAEFHDTRIYRELYGRIGVEHQLAITLPVALPRIVGLVLNRAHVDDDFDERDRTMLNLLRPHLAQAYEHVRLRDELVTQRSLLGQLLQEQGTTVVVLDGSSSDPEGLARLASFFGTGTGPSGLPLPMDTWIEAQRARLRHDPGDGLPTPFETLSTVRDGRRIVVRFVPGNDSPDALALTERSPRTDDAELRLLGLSSREVEVLQLLASGATNAEIGAQLHIASGTVKKHLDAIYRKLGVSGRVQAVSMCLELLPTTRP